MAKKIRGFLGLPGELRNRIYGYYFTEDFVVEIVAKGTQLVQDPFKTAKLSMTIYCPPKSKRRSKAKAPITLRFSRKLGHYKRVDGVETEWHTSLPALPLVCKLVHHETIVYLYHKSTFVFDAPHRIQSFVKSVPNVNLTHIKKLHLHYNTYSQPGCLEHRIWQEKHLTSWTKACRTLSKTLVNIEELRVWIRHSSRVWMDLKEPYIRPLLQFRRLTCCDQAALTKVMVDFQKGYWYVTLWYDVFARHVVRRPQSGSGIGLQMVSA